MGHNLGDRAEMDAAALPPAVERETVSPSNVLNRTDRAGQTILRHGATWAWLCLARVGGDTAQGMFWATAWPVAAWCRRAHDTSRSVGGWRSRAPAMIGHPAGKYSPRVANPQCANTGHRPAFRAGAHALLTAPAGPAACDGRQVPRRRTLRHCCAAASMPQAPSRHRHSVGCPTQIEDQAAARPALCDTGSKPIFAPRAGIDHPVARPGQTRCPQSTIA